VISYLKQAISEDNLLDKDVTISKYLIAEISRRMGNREEAVNYFDEVISLIKNDTDSKFLYELALQQKTHPQENIGPT
jgi:tetratricopeptide (TPR) repeat protein